MSHYRHITEQQFLQTKLLYNCRLGESGCWIWVGPKDKGYGLTHYKNKSIRAHRLSYEMFIGPIPEGLLIRHKCDNPSCINPDHLAPGTVQENVNDREARRRRTVKGEMIGTSKLTAEEVIAIRNSKARQVDLAKEFGVSAHCIWSIKHGHSWKHLDHSAQQGGVF